MRSRYLSLVGAGDPLQPFRFWYAFAIWQAAVGTYLYAVCAGVKERPHPERPEAGHPL